MFNRKTRPSNFPCIYLMFNLTILKNNVLENIILIRNSICKEGKFDTFSSLFFVTGIKILWQQTILRRKSEQLPQIVTLYSTIFLFERLSFNQTQIILCIENITMIYSTAGFLQNFVSTKILIINLANCHCTCIRHTINQT